MSRITITGASGYIGTALARRLAQAGHQLRRVSRHPPSLPQADTIAADLATEAGWEAALDGAEAVVHLSARTDLRAAEADPAEDARLNLLPIERLIAVAGRRATPLTVVFASTVTIFGDRPQCPVDEGTPDRPISVYDRHKQAGEQLLAEAGRDGRLRACSLRLANVYGIAAGGTPSVNRNRGILDAMLRRAAAGEPLTLYGEGQWHRDFIHLDDVVEAFRLALATPAVQDGGRYIIASGDARPLAEIFVLIAREAERLTGRAVALTSIAEPADLHPIERRNFTGNAALFRARTGWAPRVALEAGIRSSLHAILAAAPPALLYPPPDNPTAETREERPRMRFVVTGALGHIGSHLLRDLPQRFPGAEITIIDNLMTQRYAALFNLPAVGRYRFVEGDVTTMDLRPHLAGAHAVIHLAAMTDAAGSFERAEALEANNYQATLKVAEACVATGARLIGLSSTSVYGTQEAVVAEDCPPDALKPQSPYAATKLKEEALLRRLSEEQGLRAVCCRFGTIFGASPGMRFHTAVNKFCWQAVMGQALTVWRTAYEQKRPYLDLADAGRAIAFLLAEDLFDGRIYNVLTLNATVRQIVEAIRAFVPDLAVSYVDSPIMNQLSYEVSSERFRARGFTFAGDLTRGIGETVALLRTANSAAAD